MAIETLLSFDGGNAYAGLGQEFEKVVTDLCNTVLENARANLGGQYAEVEATLQTRLLSLATSGVIDGQIGTDAWQSFMAEWGSGSEMDTSNPDLAAYMGSEYWNAARDGFAITGRPEGPYLGLDGVMHDEHTGKLAGVNLELLSKTDPLFRRWMSEMGIPSNAFQPKVPLHFMRDAILSNQNLILDQLNAVLEVFNFGDFFV